MYFSPSNTRFQALKTFEAKFSETNTLVIFLRKPESLEVNEFLQVVRELHEGSLTLPRLVRSDSIVNYPLIFGDETGIGVKDFIDYACDESGCPRYLEILDEPGVVSRLVSKDATVLAVAMTFVVPLATSSVISELTESARALAATIIKPHGIEYAIVGSISQMEAFREASRKETYKLIAFALLLVGTSLSFLYRQLLTPATIMVIGMIGATASVASLGIAGVPLNTSTTASPIIAMLLVVATATHVFASFHRSSAVSPADESMRSALRENRAPIILTTLTSCAGLASLNYADAPPLAQLGNSVVAGTIVGVVALYVFAPLAARLLPRKMHREIVGWAIDIGDRKNSQIALVLAFASVIAAMGVSRINIDEDFVEYFSDAYEFRRGADFAARYMAGPKSLQIAVNTNRNGGIESQEAIQFLHTFETWLRGLKPAASVWGIADPLFRLKNTLTSRQESFDDELVAQSLLTYELSLGEGQDLREYLSSDRASTRVSVLLGPSSSTTIMELDAVIRQWFLEEAPCGYSVSVSGINVPIAYMAVENIGSLVKAVSLTVVGMTIALGIFFRSFPISMISLVAIGLPILMGFGIWGWFIGDIGLAASVVLAITIGIVIDDAIHLTYRFSQATRSGMSTKAARRYALSNAGVAITQTSIALSLGFLVLTFSGFRVNEVLGMCTAGVLICAWIFDFFLLPSALAIASRFSEAPRAAL